MKIISLMFFWLVLEAHGCSGEPPPSVTVYGQIAKEGFYPLKGGEESVGEFINRIGGILISKSDFARYNTEHEIPNIQVTLYRDGKAMEFKIDQIELWTTKIQRSDTIKIRKKKIRIDDVVAYQIFFLKRLDIK